MVTSADPLRATNVGTTSPTDGGSLELLADELRFALARLVRVSRRQGTAQGLPQPLLSALATLDGEGALSPSELADLEGVAKASMTPVLAALESMGLAARTPHPTDGRQCSVAITDKGRTVLSAERATKRAWLAQRLERLPSDDLAALQAALPALRLLVL